jgi:DNA-binding MarR family transcriptional regulator/GNAT superfamily N-acetyltransferase
MMPDPDRDRRIAAVRGFNRFYTRQIGVLRKTYLDSPYSLGEARILYEIFRAEIFRTKAPTASDIGRALDLDAGYLSRVLRSFENRGLIRREASASDARRSHLVLTPRGRKSFAPLERRSQHHTATMLERLSPVDQTRLIAAMNTIGTLLAGDAKASAPAKAFSGEVDAGSPKKMRQNQNKGCGLRAPVPGDFGWIVKRHAEIYAQEWRWLEPFEGLCAQIVADFANNHDPARERCWIAERDGENVGCIFLVRETDTAARIRLLLVEPKARGLGLGARLTGECIRFARKAGYNKITLWTHRNLDAARKIYRQAGFKLTRSEPHNSWGQPVVSEHWDLEF